jgi:adenosylcobinamide-GDP ribazoletransferase
MIRRELGRFAFAVRFLTRLPAPGAPAWSPELLARSARYFPLVGLLVGAIAAIVLGAARAFWPSGALPALLAVAAGVVVTGAFHEDGLADTADGLGGGDTPERRLAIMKDSRLGSYGALALGLALAARVLALAAIGSTLTACWVLVCAHGLGRASAVATMVRLPYAAAPEASKLKAVARDVRSRDMLIATALAGLPLVGQPLNVAQAGLLVGAAATLWPVLAASRLIGGYTGDVLGAAEQACETGFLLAASAAWTLAAHR